MPYQDPSKLQFLLDALRNPLRPESPQERAVNQMMMPPPKPKSVVPAVLQGGAVDRVGDQLRDSVDSRLRQYE